MLTAEIICFPNMDIGGKLGFISSGHPTDRVDIGCNTFLRMTVYMQGSLACHEITSYKEKRRGKAAYPLQKNTSTLYIAQNDPVSTCYL
jgi:hypothetical protein